jgi:predicted N-acyltransferase
MVTRVPGRWSWAPVGRIADAGLLGNGSVRSMIEVSTHAAIAEIAERDWESLRQADDPPFSSWAFLDALERTGCAAPDRGWTPFHITLRKDGRLFAAAPAYLKDNSEGEFVFDYAWAQFAEARLGVAYYPKLVVGVPFTPASGRRLLCGDAESGEARAAFASALTELVERLDLSSAHVLFPTEEECTAYGANGLVHRYGMQYHWRNIGYSTFDDFLGRFSSKRRNQIRREVRGPREQGILLEALSGRDLSPDVVDAVYEFYLSTVDKYFWGRRYLNRDFFHEVCSRIPDAVLVVLARDASSRRPIASAFNLVGKDALYGRYWGALEERPFLHFNVCYYRGIEECIARGLSLFEPGAGGDHKLARGFEPTVTHSAHHLAERRLDAAVRDFVRRERTAVTQHLSEYARTPILKTAQATSD